jgi:predicted transcriptional regulator
LNFLTPKAYIDVMKETKRQGRPWRIATTLRIEPVLKEGLSKLSKLEHRSLNQLANQAIKEFVARRMVEVEDDLKSTLEDLRAYRKRDPNFERAIGDFVDGEVTQDDPAEGHVVTRAGPVKQPRSRS